MNQRGVQYPFSVDEKVVIKVFMSDQSKQISKWLFVAVLCKVLYEAVMSCAGKQENPREICWERSSNHIPMPQWLVSCQTCQYLQVSYFILGSLFYPSLFVQTNLLGICLRFWERERVSASSIVLSERSQAPRLLRTGVHNKRLFKTAADIFMTLHLSQRAIIQDGC